MAARTWCTWHQRDLRHGQRPTADGERQYNSSMSSVDPFVPGGTLLTYRLVERVGTSAVWRGEDTRTGKKVAIKVLAKQLPRDPGKREGLLRDVRIGGALFHTSLVNIVEIAPAGDALLLVMEWF